MCDEAGQERRRIRPGKIGRVEVQRINVEEIAHMIERHKDDDKPAQSIPGSRAPAAAGTRETFSAMRVPAGYGFLH
jgi:hypothetical protein